MVQSPVSDGLRLGQEIGQRAGIEGGLTALTARNQRPARGLEIAGQISDKSEGLGRQNALIAGFYFAFDFNAGRQPRGVES